MFGGYYLHNECFTEDLSQLAFTWELLCDGQVVESAPGGLCVAPGGQQRLELPYDRALVRGEAFWNLYARTKEATPWAPAGHLVYKAQLLAQGTQPYWEESSIASTSPSRPGKRGTPSW